MSFGCVNRLSRRCFVITPVRHYYKNVLQLYERGLYQDLFPSNASNEIADLLKSPQCVYAGFDPTADSLHVGNLLILMGLLHWQRAGHHVIALVGSATAAIGDPSGRSTSRPTLAPLILQENAAGLRANIQQVFDNHRKYFWTSSRPLGRFTLVDNAEWLERESAAAFVAGAGRHMRLGQLLSRESVRARQSSDAGLSLAELCYQAFQAYDWLHLYRAHGCRFQLGGADQMGNINTGHELISRAEDARVYGLTMPLVTTEEGDKLGGIDDPSVGGFSGKTDESPLYSPDVFESGNVEILEKSREQMMHESKRTRRPLDHSEPKRIEKKGVTEMQSPGMETTYSANAEEMRIKSAGLGLTAQIPSNMEGGEMDKIISDHDFPAYTREERGKQLGVTSFEKKGSIISTPRKKSGRISLRIDGILRPLDSAVGNRLDDREKIPVTPDEMTMFPRGQRGNLPVDFLGKQYLSSKTNAMLPQPGRSSQSVVGAPDDQYRGEIRSDRKPLVDEFTYSPRRQTAKYAHEIDPTSKGANYNDFEEPIRYVRRKQYPEENRIVDDVSPDEVYIQSSSSKQKQQRIALQSRGLSPLALQPELKSMPEDENAKLLLGTPMGRQKLDKGRDGMLGISDVAGSKERDRRKSWLQPFRADEYFQSLNSKETGRVIRPDVSPTYEDGAVSSRSLDKKSSLSREDLLRSHDYAKPPRIGSASNIRSKSGNLRSAFDSETPPLQELKVERENLRRHAQQTRLGTVDPSKLDPGSAIVSEPKDATFRGKEAVANANEAPKKRHSRISLRIDGILRPLESEESGELNSLESNVDKSKYNRLITGARYSSSFPGIGVTQNHTLPSTTDKLPSASAQSIWDIPREIGIFQLTHNSDTDFGMTVANPQNTDSVITHNHIISSTSNTLPFEMEQSVWDIPKELEIFQTTQNSDTNFGMTMPDSQFRDLYSSPRHPVSSTTDTIHSASSQSIWDIPRELNVFHLNQNSTTNLEMAKPLSKTSGSRVTELYSEPHAIEALPRETAQSFLDIPGEQGQSVIRSDDSSVYQDRANVPRSYSQLSPFGKGSLPRTLDSANTRFGDDTDVSGQFRGSRVIPRADSLRSDRVPIQDEGFALMKQNSNRLDAGWSSNYPVPLSGVAGRRVEAQSLMDIPSEKSGEVSRRQDSYAGPRPVDAVNSSRYGTEKDSRRQMKQNPSNRNLEAVVHFPDKDHELNKRETRISLQLDGIITPLDPEDSEGLDFLEDLLEPTRDKPAATGEEETVYPFSDKEKGQYSHPDFASPVSSTDDESKKRKSRTSRRLDGAPSYQDLDELYGIDFLGDARERSPQVRGAASNYEIPLSREDKLRQARDIANQRPLSEKDDGFSGFEDGLDALHKGETRISLVIDGFISPIDSGESTKSDDELGIREKTHVPGSYEGFFGTGEFFTPAEASRSGKQKMVFGPGDSLQSPSQSELESMQREEAARQFKNISRQKHGAVIGPYGAPKSRESEEQGNIENENMISIPLGSVPISSKSTEFPSLQRQILRPDRTTPMDSTHSDESSAYERVARYIGAQKRDKSNAKIKFDTEEQLKSLEEKSQLLESDLQYGSDGVPQTGSLMPTKQRILLGPDGKPKFILGSESMPGEESLISLTGIHTNGQIGEVVPDDTLKYQSYKPTDISAKNAFDSIEHERIKYVPGDPYRSQLEIPGTSEIVVIGPDGVPIQSESTRNIPKQQIELKMDDKTLFIENQRPPLWSESASGENRVDSSSIRIGSRDVLKQPFDLASTEAKLFGDARDGAEGIYTRGSYISGRVPTVGGELMYGFKPSISFPSIKESCKRKCSTERVSSSKPKRMDSPDDVVKKVSRTEKCSPCPGQIRLTKDSGVGNLALVCDIPKTSRKRKESSIRVDSLAVLKTGLFGESSHTITEGAQRYGPSGSKIRVPPTISHSQECSKPPCNPAVTDVSTPPRNFGLAEILGAIQKLDRVLRAPGNLLDPKSRRLSGRYRRRSAIRREALRRRAELLCSTCQPGADNVANIKFIIDPASQRDPQTHPEISTSSADMGISSGKIPTPSEALAIADMLGTIGVFDKAQELGADKVVLEAGGPTKSENCENTLIVIEATLVPKRNKIISSTKHSKVFSAKHSKTKSDVTISKSRVYLSGKSTPNAQHSKLNSNVINVASPRMCTSAMNARKPECLHKGNKATCNTSAAPTTTGKCSDNSTCREDKTVFKKLLPKSHLESTERRSSDAKKVPLTGAYSSHTFNSRRRIIHKMKRSQPTDIKSKSLQPSKPERFSKGVVPTEQLNNPGGTQKKDGRNSASKKSPQIE